MISLSPGQVFFDDERVIRAVERGRRQALSRAGAYVRTRARSSIRKSKKISEPGKPPRSHTGKLKRGILFAYDFNTESTFVGAVSYEGGDAAELLEHGGTATRVVKRRRRLCNRIRHKI